jgi:uncharacterized protein
LAKGFEAGALRKADHCRGELMRNRPHSARQDPPAKAQRPTPKAQRLTPKAQRLTPKAQHPTPDAHPCCDLAVRVQPRASRNEVTGWRGEVLLIRLTAPPVEGAANAACQEFVAELLGLKRADVQLLAGEKAREKRLRVSGLTFLQIQAKIRERFPGQGGE